jgi:O-antigen/teichoic acid export membrane protein
MNEVCVGVEGDERAAQAAEVGRHEVNLALRNALKLFLSLGATAAVTVGIRFLLPRILDVEPFGRLNTAESLAIGAFVFVHLGVDQYISREVSVRPAHASDFYGGILLLRGLASLGAFAGMAVVLWLNDKHAIDWRVAFLYGLGQLAATFTNTQGALMNAIGSINAMAIYNVVTKLVWACGAVFGALFGVAAGYGALEAVAGSFFVAETLKAFFYNRVITRQLDIAWRVDLKAAWRVVVVSGPYYLNTLCHMLYGPIGIWIISKLASDKEVGWYAVAIGVASMSLIFLPIVSMVVMPMGMRLGEESEELMNDTMRGAVRLIAASTTLGSLLIALHAHDIVLLIWQERFLPSAHSLRILAAVFPVTYVAVMASLHLNMLGRIWTLVKISAVGLLINPLVNALLVRPLHERLGDGGAGTAAAVAAVLTELTVATLMLVALGKAAVDGKLVFVLVKTVVICALVAFLHKVLPWPGVWWVPLEAALYLVLAFASGALPFSIVTNNVKAALARRRARA